MVWKDNFLVDDELTTIDGFLDEFFPLCYFMNPKDIFFLNLYMGKKHIPKHFVFANFQCLRCGLCCKNYEVVQFYREQIKKWESEGREDILKHIWDLRDKITRAGICEIRMTKLLLQRYFPAVGEDAHYVEKLEVNLTITVEFNLPKSICQFVKLICVASPFQSPI